MTPNELVAVLEKHERYLDGLNGAVRANLSQQNLSGFDFTIAFSCHKMGTAAVAISGAYGARTR